MVTNATTDRKVYMQLVTYVTIGEHLSNATGASLWHLRCDVG